MSALRPIVLGIVVWGVMADLSRADALSWPDWMAWLAGQSGNQGGGNVTLGNFKPPVTSAPQPLPSSPIAVSANPQPIIANGPINTGLYASPVSTPVVSNPAPAPATTTAAAAASVPAASSNITVNAFINFGTGPYAAASSITTGGGQAWYNSPQVMSLFGGPLTAQQQQSFDATVLQRVQQSFTQSGVAVSLTDNPNISAQHTISVVANTTSASLPSAIGMTQVGGNGFSFVNVSAPSANTVDQFEWIVAHNISHELMLAFGVGENYDTTGNYLDAKLANWSMMVSPSAAFSSAAAQALNQALAVQNAAIAATGQLGAQGITESPVPEPTTLAIWAFAATALLVSHRSRARRALAA